MCVIAPSWHAQDESAAPFLITTFRDLIVQAPPTSPHVDMASAMTQLARKGERCAWCVLLCGAGGVRLWSCRTGMTPTGDEHVHMSCTLLSLVAAHVAQATINGMPHVCSN